MYDIGEHIASWGEPMLTRRIFLKAVAAFALTQPWKASLNVLARPASSRLRGKTLEGWSVVVGDGVYAAPGEPPVSLDDIATMHMRQSSLVQANIQRRRVMAHNITFLRVVDERTLHTEHECRYMFRLPFTPSVDSDMNGETVEGGLFVWDGANTRLDYGLAFQWVINPWSPAFGELRVWSGENGGVWVPIGSLLPDTRWHRVRYWLDVPAGVARLRIDNRMFELPVAATPKDASWGTEIAARLQFEVISLYPGETGTGAMHAVEVKNWHWKW